MMELNDCCNMQNGINIFEKKIIIIGAGISGLTCGYRLKELGFQNVKILEAKSRVGGRIHGIDVGSKFIELGAQWIHGQKDNVIYEIAQRKGLVDKDTFNYLDELKSFSNFSAEESKALTSLFEFLEEKVNNYSDNIGSNSLLPFLNKQFNTFLTEFGPCNFPELLNEGFEWYLKFLCEVNGCHDLSTLSLNLLNRYKECEGNQTVEIKNGISSLLNIFLNVIPPKWVLKNKPISKIDWSDFKFELIKHNRELKYSLQNDLQNCRNVKVICADGEIFLADHVVITIPLGCLKKYNHSLFIPPLSKVKQRVIDSLGFGAINKIYLQFHEVFWKPNAIFNVLWQKTFDKAILKETSDKSNTHNWIHYVDRFAYTPNHPNILCTWVTGDGAAMMESLTDDEIMNDCMKLLELLLVKKLPKPSKIFRSSWMSDPFSCGSYSYLSVDCEEENIGPFDLSVPEYSSSLCSKHPVLLFAGEATHDHYFSTVHGAYETGLREAERIFLHYRKFCKCLHANAMHAKMPNFSRDTSAVKICNTMKLMSEKMADVSLNQKNLGDKLQVVIVGAGLAGLACGLQLFKNNFSNIKILEAQDKIGGRLSSVQFNNYLLELGAQWIHGTTNELFNFAKAHKLVPPVLEEMAYEGEGVFCTSSGKIIESCLAEEVKKILYEAKSELEKGRYDKNTPESVLSFFSKAFDSYINQCKETSNVNIKKALFNWFIKLESIDNACNSMNDIAAQSFTEWDECPEELYHIEFSNGASSLIGTLVSQLPADIFRLNKSVKTVKWSEKLSSDFHDHLFSENRPENSFPVLLQCDDGENIYADSVIVTSSIGFLKENIDSFFSPSLPKNKQEALQSVGFGTVNKIYLIYDQPFWTSEDRGFQLVWENPITGNCKQLSIEHPWINDISGFDALPKFPNILLGWIGGEGAKLMETVEEEVVGNVCSDLLRIFLNQPSIPNPLKVVRSCWYSNPYMRGSYSSRSLNYYQKNSTLCNLQHPLCSSTSVSKIQELGWPTVIFAGEGFDESCFSSAHGAFHSGLKASEQLMTACSNIEDCEDKVCTSENI